MEDQDRVVAGIVQPAPGAVGNRDVLQPTAELQFEWSDIQAVSRCVDRGRGFAATTDDTQPVPMFGLLLALVSEYFVSHPVVVSRRDRSHGSRRSPAVFGRQRESWPTKKPQPRQGCVFTPFPYLADRSAGFSTLRSSRRRLPGFIGPIPSTRLDKAALFSC